MMASVFCNYLIIIFDVLIFWDLRLFLVCFFSQFLFNFPFMENPFTDLSITILKKALTFWNSIANLSSVIISIYIFYDGFLQIIQSAIIEISLIRSPIFQSQNALTIIIVIFPFSLIRTVILQL